jgi:4-hydroxy-tetrahydrodipicolinate synthase
LVETLVAAVGKRAKIIANTGGNDTHHSIELSKRAAAAGAHALLAVGPYYNKPPQAGLIAHFTAIADAVDVPMMIYNIPGRTGVNVLPETLLQLAAHRRIVAVKESSGDLGQISEIAAAAPAGFDVYSGDDHLALPIAAIGGCGVVSVASHVAGDAISEMLASFFKGDVKRATQIHHQILPLCRALFAVTSPIPVKAAMKRFDFAVGRCRLPLIELTAQQEQALDAALRPWLGASTRSENLQPVRVP